jgi:hypothetical protein
MTKEDLNQIRTVVEEVVEEVVEKIVEEKLEKKLKPIHKTMKKMQKDIRESFDFSDRNYLNHEKRLRKLETRLQITDSL